MRLPLPCTAPDGTPIATPADSGRAARVRHRLDQQTKPRGSLGRLENLAVQIACALGTDHPQLNAPQVVVCAADHGLAVRGVSAYPSAVTAQMVGNFLAGGAAVSVLARRFGLQLTVVDCGLLQPAAAAPGLHSAWLGPGTADSTLGPAMTGAQCAQALHNGAALVRDLPGNVLLPGDMGIGNTASASLLMTRLTGLSLTECVGRGTGLDDAGLAHKQAVLNTVLTRHPATANPLDTLATLGGFEIATLTGAILQAAALQRLIVVDGFIATAAAAVAIAHAPAVQAHCIFAHCSAEHAHRAWLAHLNADPLLDLGLRLGEGSGAALAWPLIDAACALLCDMATFEEAGVSRMPTDTQHEPKARARTPDAGHIRQ